MEFCNLNGELFAKQDHLIKMANRSFLYGDGLFETIRMFEGSLPFLSDHINRLLDGLQYLGYSIPAQFNLGFFEREIRKVAVGNTRIRLTVYREDGGLYTPTSNSPQFLITASDLKQSRFDLNSKGLTIGSFEGEHLTCTKLSNLKTCNSLPYIMASQFCQKQDWDDCIMLNEHHNIAESANSNIFLVLDDQRVVTPALSEGCIAGILRKQIIKLIHQHDDITVEETTVSLTDMEIAKEIWLTNSIRGIRWVKNYHAMAYHNILATVVLHELNKNISS